jgi:hypothetical protein
MLADAVADSMPTFDNFRLITLGIYENVFDFSFVCKRIIRSKRVRVLSAYAHERKYCISAEFPEYGMSGQRSPPGSDLSFR